MQDVINAISLGGLYALAALGIALIFGVMRLINFAHGELIMIGAYSLWIWHALPSLVVVLIALASVGLAALLMERVAFRPIRHADMATLLVTSFFVSTIVQNAWILGFGSRPKSVSIFPGLLESVDVGEVTIVKVDMVILGVSLLLLLAVGVFLGQTLIGLQIRAASENYTMARLLGVRGNRVIPAAFLVSGLLAAVVAIFVVSRTGNVFPTIGLAPVLMGFLATILGGMGSLRGAVVAGFVLGALTVMLQSRLPGAVAAYRDAFLFGGVLVLLLWKPQGLLPTKVEGDRV